MSSDEYKEYEHGSPLREDPKFAEWISRLKNLSSPAFSVRDAVAGGPDGRRMSDLEVLCEPITVLSVPVNVSTINKHRVLLAEIDGVHVGFCVSSLGTKNPDTLFIQVVAVVPEAQRRGIGVALLTAAVKKDPRRDIALATGLTNIGAQAMNLRFAKSIDARIRKVPLTTYRKSDLGIQGVTGYGSWVIERQCVAADAGKKLI